MRALSVVFLVLFMSACFRPRSSDPAPEPPKIEVRSRFIGPVVVHVLSGGTSTRLGMVPSNRSQSFDFPVGVNPFGASLRLIADPIGEFENYTSDAFSVSSGTLVIFTIESELRYSSVIITR
jgi:hypothetical protein